jgi:hypothetical protein
MASQQPNPNLKIILGLALVLGDPFMAQARKI